VIGGRHLGRPREPCLAAPIQTFAARAVSGSDQIETGPGAGDRAHVERPRPFTVADADCFLLDLGRVITGEVVHFDCGSGRRRRPHPPSTRSAKPPFTRTERRNTNPRPPGPQPRQIWLCRMQIGSIASLESSSVVLTCPHVRPRIQTPSPMAWCFVKPRTNLRDHRAEWPRHRPHRRTPQSPSRVTARRQVLVWIRCRGRRRRYSLRS
jgi:hypothetical protein